MVRQGKPVDAAALARKYGAREDALAGVLRHNAMPLVFEAAGGQMFGDWPQAARAPAARQQQAQQQGEGQGEQQQREQQREQQRQPEEQGTENRR